MAKQVFYYPRELIQSDTSLPVDFLSEKEHGTYKHSIQKYPAQLINLLNVDRNGSHFFEVLQLNQIGIRTVTIPELFSAIGNGMDVSHFYVDGREALLSGECTYKPNRFLAEQLRSELQLRDKEIPYVIKGLGIKPSNHTDAHYGLEFVTKHAEVIPAPDFHVNNNGRKFSRIDDNYTIAFDDNGKYTLFTDNDILSRLDLGDDLIAFANDDRLTNSIDDSRVVVVGTEGTQKFLERA